MSNKYLEYTDDKLAERMIDLHEALFGADGVMAYGSDEEKSCLLREYELLEQANKYKAGGMCEEGSVG